jgi:hypothetical protein
VLLAYPHEPISALILEHSEPDPSNTTHRGSVALHDTRERARVNVTRAIGTVLRRIEQHHPLLAAHLRVTIKTGAVCSYTPDPRLPVRWSVTE